MRYPLYYTVKEWKKFKVFKKKTVNGKDYFLDLQEIMCKKYDIILTNHKTNKEKMVWVIKSINAKNFDKGMKVFDGAMKEFDGMMKDFGKELGGGNSGGISQQKLTGKSTIGSSNNVSLWSKKKPSKKSSVSIWSLDSAPKKTKKRRKKTIKPKSINQMIWGDKKK